MSEPKQSFRQRCGFDDPDLKSPEHDRMVLWIGKHAKDWIAGQERHDPLRDGEKIRAELRQSTTEKLQECEGSVRREEERFERYRERDDEFAVDTRSDSEQRLTLLYSTRGKLSARLAKDFPLPPAPEAETKITFEVPVLSGNFIIGFLDAKATVNQPELAPAWEQKPDWAFRWHEKTYGFEAKPLIRSLGELMRQLRAYETYCRNMKLVVVSPDVRYRDTLIEQGFGFWEYPAVQVNSL